LRAVGGSSARRGDAPAGHRATASREVALDLGLLPRLGLAAQTRAALGCVSYAQGLANDHSIACRNLIESDLYQRAWGDRVRLARGQNEKHRFDNEDRGHRIATSIGGTGTGLGADILIIDDAHNTNDAYSAALLERTSRRFAQTFATRLNNPKAAIIVTGQRVAPNDLPGRLIEQGHYTQACFPALHEPDHPYPFAGDPRSEPGEPLFRELWDADALEEQMSSMGSYAASAQYQQRPAPAGGTLFHAEDVCYYDPNDFDLQFDNVLQAWDTSGTVVEVLEREIDGIKRVGTGDGK